MTPERDVSPKPQAQASSRAPAAGSQEDAARVAALYQEINERRARIENSELLRHLRGL